MSLDTPAGIVARADRDGLRQAVVNLLENAIDALAETRPPRRLALAVRAADGAAPVRVSDNGPGVDRAGGGVGLGSDHRPRRPPAATARAAAADDPGSARDAGTAGAPAPRTFREAKQAAVERFEREFLSAALERHRGNVSKTADEVGMYRQQLQQKLAELVIEAERWRRRDAG